MTDYDTFDAIQAALMLHVEDLADLVDRPPTVALIRDLECMHTQLGQTLGQMRAKLDVVGG